MTKPGGCACEVESCGCPESRPVTRKSGRPAAYRARAVRPHTENAAEMRRHLEVIQYHRVQRPKTRTECVNGPRPCPWVSCEHHLAIDVSDTPSITFNFPDLEVWEMTETCALDVADRGSHTLEQVGDYLNLTRERARQLESAIGERLKRNNRAWVNELRESVAEKPVGDIRELWSEANENGENIETAESTDDAWGDRACSLDLEAVSRKILVDAYIRDSDYRVLASIARVSHVRGFSGTPSDEVADALEARNPVRTVDGPETFGRGVTIYAERCDVDEYPRDTDGELIWDEADGLECRVAPTDNEPEKP